MNNKFLLIFSFIIAITLLPFPAFALTYNGDSGFNVNESGLINTYYRDDLPFQEEYNRDFEDTFDLASGECSAGWCGYDLGSGAHTYGVRTSAGSVISGSHSLELEGQDSGGAANSLVIAQNEIVGDANVCFNYKLNSVPGLANFFRYGYSNDLNNLRQVALITISDTLVHNVCMQIPSGNNRIYFSLVDAISVGNVKIYIDDIEVNSVNSGVFRTSIPDFCLNQENCSNKTNWFLDPKSEDLYYAVEYLPSSTCEYRLNKSLSNFAKGTGSFSADGTLSHGLAGMYYFKIDTSQANANQDLNIEVKCSRSGAVDKGFFSSTITHKYNLLDGANFEESFNLSENSCSNNWCSYDTGTSFDRFVQAGASSSNQYDIAGVYDQFNGLFAVGRWSGAAATATTIYYGAESLGDSNIFFAYRQVTDAGSTNWQYGYSATDGTSFISLGSLQDNLDWNDGVSFYIPDGSYVPAFRINRTSTSTTSLKIDGVNSTYYGIDATIEIGADEATTFFGEDTLFYSDYEIESSGVDISSGDCTLEILGIDYSMIYNSSTSRFEYNYPFIATGTYDYNISCVASGYDTKQDSDSVEITYKPSIVLQVSDLVNVSGYDINNVGRQINFFITGDDSFEFSINSAVDAYNINYYWDKGRSSKQYYIYTSDDGVDWTFNSTLTYGAGYNDPVQKTLISSSRYGYSITDDLTISTKKYYKMIYRDVADYWETITNASDWVKVSPVGIFNDYSLNQDWDLFNDSNYSNILAYTINNYPDLTSSDLSTGFEFQFNAYASDATIIKVGYRLNGVNTTLDVPITTSQVRYSVPVDPSSNDAVLVIYSNDVNSKNVFVTDYSIIPNAYFTRRLELKKEDGSDLTAMLLSGESQIVIQENSKYQLLTQAYDKTGNLNKLKVDVLLGSTIVKTYEIDLSKATEDNKKFSFNELLDGVIDLNGYYGNPTDFRDITFKATLIDDQDNEVEEQFQTIKLLQYPFFDDDISVQVAPLTNKVGEHPEFQLKLNQKEAQAFLGVRVRLYDEGSSLASPDYEEYIYNSELNCDNYCLKRIVLDQFVYESESAYKATFSILLNTEYESDDNPLTTITTAYYVSYKEYETARILQVMERADSTYRNDEKIELVLQIRDVPFIDLKERTGVYLTIDECSGSSGVCDSNGTTKFFPQFQYYDPATGYNYFYFNSLFYKDDGSLLDDGDYIRFQSHIADKYYSHEAVSLPDATLASKCADIEFLDIGSFLYNFFLGDITGCVSPADAIVEIGDAAELRLLIDEDHVLTGDPTQSMVCLSPDNESYENTLQQDLLCAIILKKSQKSIDVFDVLIGNEYSDYTKEGLQKQFLEFSIPAEDIIFNDPFMMQQALRSEYSTDEINTIGEFLLYGFDNLFSGIANPLIEAPTILTDTGIIKNLNWDFNFDNAFDPNFVTGLFFLKVEGLQVINQYDYIDEVEGVDVLKPVDFREFMVRENRNVFVPQTMINVFASDMKLVEKFKVDSPLIIYAKPSPKQINFESIDENTPSNTQTEILKFDFIVDMVFNSGRDVSRVHLPMTLSQIIVSRVTLNSIIKGFAGVAEDPFGSVSDFATSNWFLIFILIVTLLVGSLIYANFKGNGTTFINKGR